MVLTVESVKDKGRGGGAPSESAGPALMPLIRGDVCG